MKRNAFVSIVSVSHLRNSAITPANMGQFCMNHFCRMPDIIFDYSDEHLSVGIFNFLGFGMMRYKEKI